MFKFSHEQCAQILEKHGFSIRLVESNRQIHSDYLEKRYSHSFFFVLRILSTENPARIESKLYKGYQRCYHAFKSCICDYLEHYSNIIAFEVSIFDRCVSLNNSQDILLHRYRSRVTSSASIPCNSEVSLDDFKSSSKLQSHLEKLPLL